MNPLTNLHDFGIIIVFSFRIVEVFQSFFGSAPPAGRNQENTSYD